MITESSGTIYSSSKNVDFYAAREFGLPGQVERLRKRTLKFFGLAIIYLSIFSFVAVYRNVIFGEIKYVLNFQKSPSAPSALAFDNQNMPDLGLSALKEKIAINEASSLGLSADFSLHIPAIDAKSMITKNINPADEESYLKALETSIAHAKGSDLPGEGGTIYLFAHSTDSLENLYDYNAVFYLLRKLKRGEEVVVYYQNQKFVYTVKEKIVVNANDTSWIGKDFGEETLILQTCDPPGTTLRRLLIIATKET